MNFLVQDHLEYELRFRPAQGMAGWFSVNPEPLNPEPVNGYIISSLSANIGRHLATSITYTQKPKVLGRIFR